MKKPQDAPAVIARAEAIAAQQQTQYWIVLDVSDITALLVDIVTKELKAEAIDILRGEPRFAALIADVVRS